MKEVKVPLSNVNDLSVTVSAWLVKEGDFVNAGAPLCSVETSKAVFDIEASEAGYVKNIRYQVGQEAPVQSVICHLVDSLDEKVKALHTNVTEKTVLPNATVKAKCLADELGVDITKIPGHSIIREKDVYVYYEKKHISLAADGEHAKERELKEGKLSEQSYKRLVSDENFAGLPNDEKIGWYRSFGAHIGSNVRFDPGAMIRAKQIVIEDDVVIGRNSIFEGETIILGKMVKIGDHCHLLSAKILIGDVSTVADRVVCDLSGGKTASSMLRVGKHCLLASETYINTARSVQFGDRVALSPRAMVFTHSYWQSVLDGYPAIFEDVFFEDDVWIGAAAQILPGVRIGRGSVVMSNSLVTTSVASYTMVGGVPAGVVKRNLEKELSLEVKKEKVTDLLEEFTRFLEEEGFVVGRTEKSGSMEYSLSRDGQSCTLIFVSRPAEFGRFEVGNNYIGFGFKQTRQGVTFFDFEETRFYGTANALTDEFRNFCRRRGILFSPEHWRYDMNKALSRAGFPL